jgi:RNA polymerase sigma-70 factor, ECF subfamily
VSEASAAEIAARRLQVESEISAIYPGLLALLRRLVGRDDTAQELCQDAIVRLMEHAERITEIRAWLYRTATHLAWDWLRHQRVRREHAALHPLVEQVTPDLSVAATAAQRIARLQLVLQQLPEQPRRVFQLSRLAGLSQHEIAQRLGIARKTVENHLTRALALLAKALGDPDESRH